MNGAEMTLWTIIDSDIYMERDPFYALKTSGERDDIAIWYQTI